MTTHLLPAIVWGHLEIACAAGRIADRGPMDPKWERRWPTARFYGTVGDGPVCKKCLKGVRLMMAANEQMLSEIQAGVKP